MKKLNLTLAVLIALAIGVIGLSPANAQLVYFLDATGTFDYQSGPRCTRTPHTFPGATASEDGEVWTQDCDIGEGFVLPFNWPPGLPVTAGNVPVTISTRVHAPGGDGLTTTFVCWERDIACRNTPVLTIVPPAQDAEVSFAMVAGGAAQDTLDVKNTDATSFLRMQFVAYGAPGAAYARCELRVTRCTDDTPFVVGAEFATVHFE